MSYVHVKLLGTCLAIVGLLSACPGSRELPRHLALDGISLPPDLGTTEPRHDTLKFDRNGVHFDASPPKDTEIATDSTPITCGLHAENKNSKCVCTQGYIDTNVNVNDGCEGDDPECGMMNCGHCPVGYCGSHAICRDNLKCRCNEWGWKNSDGSWTNGCEEPTIGCSANNCNACAQAICGPHTDCSQSVCKCTEQWANTNNDWLKDGCETPIP